MQRHLSAVSFLNNISLNGSCSLDQYQYNYHDGLTQPGFTPEDRQRLGIALGIGNPPGPPWDYISGGSSIGDLNQLKLVGGEDEVEGNNLVNNCYHHSSVPSIPNDGTGSAGNHLYLRSTNDSGASQNSDQFPVLLESPVPPRIRSYTGTCSFNRTTNDVDPSSQNQTSSTLTNTYLSSHSKRAHFSSNESLEPVKAEVINASDPNLHKSLPIPLPPPETKIVRLKSFTNLTLRDERIVILVSQRTPVLVYSSLPYYRSKNFVRATERAEALNRRARNVSGSRPMSALSDPPDPLEQLIVSNELEEVSYGYLLQPTKRSKPAEPSTVAAPAHNLESDVSKYTRSHAPISRCTSGDGNPISKTLNSAIGTTMNNGTTPPREEAEDAETATTTNTSSTGETNEAIEGTEGPESNGTNDIDKNWMATYSPHLLDDPEFRAGKHKTLLTFTSYITSVIDYCKASDLKKELNDKFRDRFPHIQLTLSKLKSLKREMRRVAKTECNIDLLTVAQAYVYFEKLILGSFVTKYNRKFCAGACLLLSAKLNDVKGANLNNLIEMIERTFRVNRKELLSFEFAVLVALEFTLHLPTWEVFPHYQRLLYES